jgi:hypothetical protein
LLARRPQQIGSEENTGAAEDDDKRDAGGDEDRLIDPRTCPRQSRPCCCGRCVGLGVAAHSRAAVFAEFFPFVDLSSAFRAKHTLTSACWAASGIAREIIE